MSINRQIQEYDEGLVKEQATYSGLLGLAIDGSRKVNIPSRAGYVYVRLRDSLSEVIQAFNDKVSPVYDFPVLIQRKGNRWYVAGRDDERYEVWGTSAPYLPQHGDQHSFNRDGGGGGDTVFVYPDQFMPLLVYPSGTTGAGNLLVAPYVLQRTSDYIYVGNTGTGNLLIYKPSDAQAIVGLVYLDKTTGNPGVLIASGTPIAATITGTAGIVPYVPFVNSNQEPLYAFRLVSGTTSLTWNNLHNVRQLVGGSSSASTGTSGGGIAGVVVQDEGVTQGTGTVFNFVGSNISVSVSGTVARVFVTGSAGGSLPSFITGSIPFSNAAGTLTENSPYLRWRDDLRSLRVGKDSPKFNFADIFPIGVVANNADESVSFGIQTYGTGSLGSPTPNFGGYRSRGTFLSPTPVKKGDALLSFIGNGYDGSDFQNVARVRFYADNDFVTGSNTSTRMEFEVVPSGSATRRTQFSIYGNAVEIPTGSTFNIGGVPHTHPTTSSNGWDDVPYTVNYFSSDSPSFVINVQANVTGSYGAGTRWKLGTVGTTKYFIQTAEPTYVSGAYTSINLFGGTNYTLTTGTISSPQTSRMKFPVGFPAGRNLWDIVALTDSTDRAKNSPVGGTYYYDSDTGNLNFYMPIGCWSIMCNVTLSAYRATAGTGRVFMGISTSSSSFSDDELVAITGLYTTATEGQQFDTKMIFKTDIVAASKTQYFIVLFTPLTINQIAMFNGATGKPMKIILRNEYY